MGADTVTIAGHVAERGSEAEAIAWAHRVTRAAARIAAAPAVALCLLAARLGAEATRAPGYLGPATDTETTK